MRRYFKKLLTFLFQIVLKTRYRIEVKGLTEIVKKKNQLNNSGGLLFLFSHPGLIDPVIGTSILMNDFDIRTVVTERVLEDPILRNVISVTRPVSVPKLHLHSNVFTKERGEAAYRKICQGLRNGENFMMSPSGALKLTGVEKIGGASWAHRILHDVPEANIVLMRYDGLWGSMFSRAITGQSPEIFPTFIRSLKIILKNWIFFVPKRDLFIEFKLMDTESMLKHKTRRDFNFALEKWFNNYRNHQNLKNNLQSEAITLVSYSVFKHEIPTVDDTIHQEEETIDVARIPKSIQNAVKTEIASYLGKKKSDILPDQHLSNDLGLDSLDASAIIIFLDEKYKVRGVKPQDLTSVSKVMAIAAGQIDYDDDETKNNSAVYAKWLKYHRRSNVEPPQATTIIESFLRVCDRMPDAYACGSDQTGIMTYRKMKLGVHVLAEELRHLPGKNIGILLPSTSTVAVCILACMLAGKVPVMINWTVGSRNLDFVVRNSNLHIVLTAKAFLDKLEGVDLINISSLLVFLEDIKSRIPITSKIKGLIKSYSNADEMMDYWNVWDSDKKDNAVILYTSGTESDPKAVPLSHENILSNLRAILATVVLEKTDIMYGILPPFHSFGFSITTILPLISGVRVVFHPNPTESRKIANGIGNWNITMLASPPSFMKNILAVSEPNQLKSIRYFLSGAEKAPESLFQTVEELGVDKELLEGYGITECSPVVTVVAPGTKPVGVGKPLSNVQLLIVHQETHKKIPQNERGLILVRGPNVFSGYINSDKDPFVTVGNKIWYNTGDLGFIDKDGNLNISGRLKRFVKIGGEMISLSAIETSLVRVFVRKGWFPEDESTLAVIPNETKSKPTLHLYCTNKSLDVSDVNRELFAAGFSNINKLTSLEFVPEIPLTGSGKVAYKELERKLLKVKM